MLLQVPSQTQWYAGINRPFFVTDAMVRSALEAEGLENVRFFKRGQTVLPVNPHLYSVYSDDWDEWMVADYRGPSKSVEVNPRWKWLIFTPLTSTAIVPASEAPQNAFTSAVSRVHPAWILTATGLELYFYYRVAKRLVRRK